MAYGRGIQRVFAAEKFGSSADKRNSSALGSGDEEEGG